MGTLIDTSVWIDAFHPKSPRGVKALATSFITRDDAVLCEPVYVEFFRGMAKGEMRRAQSLVDTLPMLSTPQALWKDALPLLRSCAEAGIVVNILDALIAIIAREHRARIVTFDHHFLPFREHGGVEIEVLSRPS
jgi:predicted nucleic acid-binding protein